MIQLVRSMAAMLAAVLIATPAAADAVADFYRGKTVRLLVGAAVGGGYDAVGRAVARHIGRHIRGNPAVVVENMPGAASLIVMNYAFNKGPRDGTVMALTTSSVPLESRLRLMSPDGIVPFDVNKANWLGSPAQQPQVLFVWHDVPVNSLDDLKKNKLVLGAIAAGSDTYILPTLLRQVFGANTQVISGYKGTADILIAMEKGEVQGHVALLANVTAGSPGYLRDKKIRIVLQFGRERARELPDVPTIVEWATSEADREMFRFYTLKYEMAYPITLAPDIPADRLAAMQKAFNETMDDPQYQADAKRAGLDISPIGGEEMSKLIRKINETPPDIVERLRNLILAQHPK
jgi:tripartite-type tricarboxylate transporter receptor subunit TctC